jgi:hypothetical protein
VDLLVRRELVMVGNRVREKSGKTSIFVNTAISEMMEKLKFMLANLPQSELAYQ